VGKKEFIMNFVVGMPKKKYCLDELYRYQIQVFVISVIKRLGNFLVTLIIVAL
jgi:hypothetical protein